MIVVLMVVGGCVGGDSGGVVVDGDGDSGSVGVVVVVW